MAEGPTTPDVGGALARGWWILLVCVLVLAAGGFAVGLQWPTKYEAVATVSVSEPGDSTESDEPDMETERLTVSSSRVLEPASEDLGIDEKDLRDSVSVVVPQDSRVMEISATAADRDDATERANEVAAAYAAYKEGLRSAETEARRELIRTEIRRLRDLLQRARRPEVRETLLTEVATLQTEGLADASATGAVRSLTSATAPSNPATPPPAVFAIGGAALGLLLGVLLALLRERTRSGRARRVS